MAEVTRDNGIPPAIAGNIVSTSQIKLFLIDCGGDLRAEDDAANEAVELFLKVVQPLAYCFVNGNTGAVSVIVDGHGVTKESLQREIRALGSAAGPNDYDFSGATVNDAVTFAAAT